MKIVETIPTVTGEKRYAVEIQIGDIMGMPIMTNVFIGKTIEECEEYIKNNK